MMHGVIRFKRTVHTQHTEKLFVGTRISTQAHQGVSDRESQHPGQTGQLFARITLNHPTAGVDHRSFTGHQHFYGFLYLTRVSPNSRVIGTHGN